MSWPHLSGPSPDHTGNGPNPCFAFPHQSRPKRWLVPVPKQQGWEARPAEADGRVETVMPSKAFAAAAAAVPLTRPSVTTLDLVTLQRTIGEGLDRDPLLALSQRKLNALGLA